MLGAGVSALDLTRMALDIATGLREGIEKFARGNKAKRNALFADLTERIDQLGLRTDLADRVLTLALSIVHRTLIFAAQREAATKDRPSYDRERRKLEKTIAWLSEHWLVRPFRADLIEIRSLHEAFCPHGNKARTCQQIWSRLAQYQSGVGSTWQAMMEARDFLLKHGVDPETADCRDFCPPDLRGQDERVPLEPVRPAKGAVRDLARDILIEELVGLGHREGLLTAAGISVDVGLDFVSRILLRCFDWKLIKPDSLKRQRARLLRRAATARIGEAETFPLTAEEATALALEFEALDAERERELMARIPLPWRSSS